MIEFTLICDDCGRIIHASKISAATARHEARMQCHALRIAKQHGVKDLCQGCGDRALASLAKPRTPEGTE